MGLNLNQSVAKCLHLNICYADCKCIDQCLASAMASFFASVSLFTTTPSLFIYEMDTLGETLAKKALETPRDSRPSKIKG